MMPLREIPDEKLWSLVADEPDEPSEDFVSALDAAFTDAVTLNGPTWLARPGVKW
jgi:hypothetical protein